MKAQGIQIARAFVSVEPDMTALKAGFAETEARSKAWARSMEATTGKVASASAADAAATSSSWKKSAKAVEATGATITKAGRAVEGAGRKMTKGITVPVLAIAAASGKLAIDFEKSMRNVNSIAQLPEKQFRRLQKQVLDLAGPTAQAPKTLAEGLYDLVSSGFDAHESITILGASARAATAGLTTTEVSTKAVAAALNAYRRPASDAKQISDDLFQTVNLGVVSFDELASTIGYVLPAASTMGVDIKQVGASISTLTKEGQSGANAVTNINAALTSFIKPSKAMKGVLGELGYETSKQLITQKGFQGALETVSKAVGGSEEAIGKLFPNVRAMRAVFGLTGANVKSAGEDLKGFASDSGATNKVLQQQSKSLSYQWNQLKAEASVLGIQIGNALIPVLRDLAHEVAPIIGAFTELPPDVQATAIKFGLAAAAMGPVVVIGGKIVSTFGKIISLGGKAAEAVAGVGAAATAGTAAPAAAGAASADAKKLFLANSSGAITGAVTVGAKESAAATTSMESLTAASAAAGPEVLAVVAAIAALTAGFVLLYKQSARFREMVGGLVTSAKVAFGEVVEQIEPLIHSFDHMGHAIEHLNGPFGAIAKVIKGVFLDTLEVAFQTAGQIIRGLGKVFAGEVQVIRGVIELVADLLEGRWGKAWKAVKVIFAGGVKSVIGVLQMMKAGVLAPIQLVGKVMTTAFGGVWGEVEAVFVSGINAVIGFIDSLLGVVEKIPGVGNLQIGKVHLNTGSAGAANTGSVSAPAGHTSSAGYFSGGQITAPRAIVGEQAPAHNEWVIATNPSYRSANLGYWAAAGRDLGVKGFAEGGRSAGMGSIASFDPIGIGESVLGTAGEVVSAPVRVPAELAVKGLGDVAGWGAEQFIGALPKPDLPFPFQGLGSYIVEQVADWIKSGFSSGELGAHDKGIPGLSGGSVASPQAFAGYMLEAGFPHSQKVIAEGLGTIAAESGYKVNNAQGPGGHIGPWAESPAFGSVAVREDPRGSTFAAYRVGYAPTGSFQQAWGQWEASQSGTTGAMLASQYMSIAAQALSGNGHTSTGGANKGTVTAPKGHTSSAGYAAGGKIGAPKGTPLAGSLVQARPTGSAAGGGASAESMIAWAQHFLGASDQWGYPGEWCGAFMGADVKAHGMTPPTGYPAASAWGSWGTSDSGPTRGDIVVIGGSGHVGLALGGNKMISGNFSNTVAESTIGEAAGGRPITGYRTPPYTSGPTSKTKAGTAKERVPAVYNGAHTHSLSFGSMPKSLKGVEKELNKRRAELHTYRAAAAAAKHRPATQHAIEANVTALQGRIRDLEHQRAQMRREAAHRKFSHRLEGRLTAIGGFDNQIALSERGYNEASQFAEQLVDLEPTMPVNPDEGNELKYLFELQSYVENKEQPAYARVLGAEATWRNTILGGESAASRMGSGWEKKVRETDSEIDEINRYTKKVADDVHDYRAKHPKGDLPDWLKAEVKKEDKWRDQLPNLHFKDEEFRKAIGVTREAFYGGRKNPIEPPGTPIPGSGSFEEALVGVQGYHWPKQHGAVARLPTVPKAGMYGGLIWQTQETIQELGLKVASALGAGVGEVESLGSAFEFEGGEESGETEAATPNTENYDIAKELKELIEREQGQRALVGQLQKPVVDRFLPPFGGSFATGGRVPGPAGAPRTIIAHGGEEFEGLHGGSSSAPVIYVIVEDAAIDSSKIKVVADEAIDVRMSKGGRSAGRRLPGGSGGNFGQGR